MEIEWFVFNVPTVHLISWVTTVSHAKKEVLAQHLHNVVYSTFQRAGLSAHPEVGNNGDKSIHYMVPWCEVGVSAQPLLHSVAATDGPSWHPSKYQSKLRQ